MFTIHNVLARTNWYALREQKKTLMMVIEDSMSVQVKEDLSGILHLIDSYQDAAEEEGYAVVWLDNEERPA